MHPVIKYAAIRVAAYVVYRYIQTLFPEVATPAAVPQQPAQTAAPAIQQVQLPEPKTKEEEFTRAAVDETWGRNAPVTLSATVDEWNWYRATATGIAQPDPLLMGFDATTRSYPITARQYWDALRMAVQGMSGMWAQSRTAWGTGRVM